jgi:6-phosphogluconolactonase/glucosamine-6-phosphate isomerase/deaminase
MSERGYQFVRERTVSREGKEEKESKVITEITVVGSLENSAEQNKEKMGAYVAEMLISEQDKAKKDGKRLLFDAATGSTPKPVWPELKKKTESGDFHPEDLIVIGHEEAWGPYEKDGKSDFDAYRERELFTNLDAQPKSITSIYDVSGKRVEGNIAPMHLDDNPEVAAKEYAEILKALHAREDVQSFGLYGVGEDGHIGEIQMGGQGVMSYAKRKNVYVDDISTYSMDDSYAQLYRLQSNDGEFLPHDNVFSERGSSEDVGRIAREGYGGIEKIVGLGWQEMLRLDTMMMVFNNKQKLPAFEAAIKGTYDGKIKSKDGVDLHSIKSETGEGEKIYDDLVAVARRVEESGFVAVGTIEKFVSSNEGTSLKCGRLFQELYASLEKNNINVDDDGEYYQDLWKMLNRYIGKRLPVATLISMRALANKRTELIVLPEVIRDTEFEHLAK